jgi:hypothetical protein
MPEKPSGPSVAGRNCVAISWPTAFSPGTVRRRSAGGIPAQEEHGPIRDRQSAGGQRRRALPSRTTVQPAGEHQSAVRSSR